MGIEPTPSAWKAEVLPLNYTRANSNVALSAAAKLVEGGGFEPPKAEPSDLQSDPFGHSGTPPKLARYFDCQTARCQPLNPPNFTLGRLNMDKF